MVRSAFPLDELEFQLHVDRRDQQRKSDFRFQTCSGRLAIAAIFEQKRDEVPSHALQPDANGLDSGAYSRLIPEQDLHTRLSTFSGTYIHDTRDNILDAHKGQYQTFQIDFNSRVLGSNVSFGKLLLQAAYYHPITESVIWANSIRLGFIAPFGGSHIPISQNFFTGGGSTLRGFPLNGAGPQRTVSACNDPRNSSTCSLIRVPVGGTQLAILNSEFRIPAAHQERTQSGDVLRRRECLSSNRVSTIQ